MKALLITLLLTSIGVVAVGQKKTVVIGAVVDRPNALLVINPPDGNQGFLLPQLTTVQRLSISPTSPDDDGLVVFDITDKAFYYWSAGTWHKGLGQGNAQVLSFDPLTNTLSITGGGSVSLSSLKEIPVQTGNAGRFLTTDGTTLSWATIAALGDISSVVTGQGLTGGATAGDVNLSVNTDGSTIRVNGSNQVELADNAITPQKIASPGAARVLTTNAAGAVTWESRTNFSDQQNLALSGNDLIIDNGSGVNLSQVQAAGHVQGPLNNLVITDGVITNSKISSGAVLEDNIANANVTPTKIAPGSDNQILTTVAGVVSWVNPMPFPVITDATMTGDGTATQALSIADGGVSTSKIAAGAVTSAKLASASVIESTIDANAVTAQKIQNGSVTFGKVGADAINSSNIIDGSVTTTDISSGGNDLVLTTSASGQVIWEPKSAFGADDQTLSLVGNSLSITDGNQVDLNDVVAFGQVTGPVGNLIIQPGTNGQVLVTNAGAAGWVDASTIIPTTVTDGSTILGDGSATPLRVGVVASGNIQDGAMSTVKIADGAVTRQKLGAGAVGSAQIEDGEVNTADLAANAVTPSKILHGTSNQVLVTNAAGDATTWTDQDDFLLPVLVDGVTILGDGKNTDLTVGVIQTANIADDAIIHAKLGNDAVTSINVLDASITHDDLATDAVTEPKLEANAVSRIKIQNGAVDAAKIEDGAVNSNKILNGTILAEDLSTDAVTEPKLEANAVSAVKIQNGAITGPKIQDGVVTSEKITDGTIASIDLADDAVTRDKILNLAVTPAKINPGTANQVLVTNGAGTAVTWADQNTLVPNIVVDNATVVGNGTSGNPLTVGVIQTNDIADDAVSRLKIQNASIDNTKIASDAISSAQIIDGNVNTVDLADDAVSNAKIGANAVNSTQIIDGSVNTVDLTDAAVTTNKIQNAAVDNPKIAANSVNSAQIIDATIAEDDLQDAAVATNKIRNFNVTPIKIAPGNANQVLVTNGGATAVAWADQNTLVPNILTDNATITGNGTSGNALTVGTIQNGNIADGSVDALKLATDAVTAVKIQSDAVTTPKIVNNAVTTAKIDNAAVTTAKIAAVGANQVLTTDGTGATVNWTSQSAIPVDGDVTGNLGATAVTQIRGRAVSNNTPNPGDVLVWDGATWIPQANTVAPAIQYLSVDPSAFDGLNPGTGSSPYVSYTENNPEFVTTRSGATEMVAPVNLPHGAVVTGVTVYYQYTFLLGSITTRLERKVLGAATTTNVASGTSPLLSLFVQNNTLTLNGANTTVDNNTYSYKLHVIFSAPATQRIYGVKIQYTK